MIKKSGFILTELALLMETSKNLFFIEFISILSVLKLQKLKFCLMSFPNTAKYYLITSKIRLYKVQI